jgi:hypothetical protein
MALKHNHFFSFGENFGRTDCHIPDDGLGWRPTRQPVVLDVWPRNSPRVGGPLTTVMQWDSYPTREYNGVTYGMKSRSFEEYFDLPRRTTETLELAVGSKSAPRSKLREFGWRLRDPLDVTRDPWTFQEYLAASKGEFTLAKHGFAVTNSGWFSERTAGYLASARPVVVHDTGFQSWLPPSAAVLPFRSPDEAQDALDALSAGYEQRCREARDVVAAYFSHDRVLGALLEQTSRSQRRPEPAADIRGGRS